MKRTCMMLVALALIFGLAQCKKNNETNSTENEDEKVFITLDVSQGDGSKLDVDPPHVVFQTGDKIYVASNGVYVGYLEYNGTNFGGEISNAIEGQPLYFYLLGNVTPAETLTSGSTTSCSVVISDQTVNKPVIACNKSSENFGTTNTFTSTLRNKCALVKFNVTTLSTVATCITGFNNKVMVNFSDNTLTNSQEGNGVITLPAGNGEKWAILLPQNALEAGTEGSAYSVNGAYTGTRGAVPAITNNAYLTMGIDVTITGDVPIGAICGRFTINENGDQVYFSQGNLQYQPSTNTWRFANNQYDTCDIGELQYYIWVWVDVENNEGYYLNVSLEDYYAYLSDFGHHDVPDCYSEAEVSTHYTASYSGWIDLFGWGTSGYNHGANCYQPWSTSQTNGDYYAYGSSTYNLYDQTGQADWGYNAISNGVNQENLWRTLTFQEWDYVFKTRNTTSGIRYAKAVVNNVNGFILLPDDWSSSTYYLKDTNIDDYESGFGSNVISASQWSTLENAGAVFLPAVGSRNGTSVRNAGSRGGYWSASGDRYGGARCVQFSSSSLSIGSWSSGIYGLSVRLVRVFE